MPRTVRQAHRPHAAAPSRLAPLPAQPVEQDVDHRRRQQRQQLTGNQPADDGDPERLTQLRAFAKADRKRHCAERRGECRHENRAEAQQARLAHRRHCRQATRALGLEREVDDEDRILLDDADQQEHADQRNNRELHSEQQQRKYRADAGRGQRGEHGDRID